MMFVVFSFLTLFSINSYAVTHWSTPLRETLTNQGILTSDDSLTLGQTIDQDTFESYVDRLSDDEIVVENIDGDLTRLDAVKIIVKRLGYDYLAMQINDVSSAFTDVTQDMGYVTIALDTGIITMNDTATFRPDDLLKSEEAIALLYNIYKNQSLKIQNLSSYYAISSYSQISYLDDLDQVIFGWSRLDYNQDADRVYINTTSSNDNEYRIPSGYQESITSADEAGVQKFLMITVDNDYIDSTGLTKSIVTMETYRNQAIEAIVSELDKDRESFGFNGVLIDFEGLKGEASAVGLDLFLQALNEKLGDTYQLAVAVHPVMSDGLSYFDGYNFKEIGQVADYVILMAHDYYPKKLTEEEMNSGITITPVTPIDDVYTAIKAILDPETGVEDHAKVIFQLSMDSAQWKLLDGVIINETPYRPTFSAILNRITNGVTPQYSVDLKSSFMIFQNDSDNTRNVVWYEDARSVSAKIRLALEMGIENISVWRLGTIPNYEDEGAYLDIWDTIQSQTRTIVE